MLLVGNVAAVPLLFGQGGIASCNEFLIPKMQIKGKMIGQESCQMIETDFIFEGRKYHRMDMGISGTLDGYVTKQGQYGNYFLSDPEFLYEQAGITFNRFYGIGHYEAAKGSALIFIYPAAESWNGKEFVTAHGAGESFKTGSLKPWDKNLNSEDPTKDLSSYEKLMLEKGYALAKTRRSTPYHGGDVPVTLEDGSVFPEANFNEQPRLVLGFAEVGWKVLEKRLGRKPSRTYWYGHSNGGRMGRLLNYQPGLNVSSDGKHIIDGILADDAGSGEWEPIVMKNGKDVLFTPQEDLPWFVTENASFAVPPNVFSGSKHKDWFVPQIDISHQLYVNETPDHGPSFVSNNFLWNKYLNTKYLKEKGLGDKQRMYEIVGVSHIGDDYAPSARRSDVVVLPISRLMDGFMDILDAWVENGTKPPDTKSDWTVLSPPDKDGLRKNAALRMPEIACPTGVYYQFPPSAGLSGQGITGFASFTGNGLEPLDGRGPVKEPNSSSDNYYFGFVDMNRNATRDAVESMTEAWQRLGLISPDSKFSRSAYTACVQKSVNALAKEKFISPKTVKLYMDQAATIQFPSE